MTIFYIYLILIGIFTVIIIINGIQVFIFWKKIKLITNYLKQLKKEVKK